MKIGINSINVNDIYNKVTDEDLVNYYFGINTFPCLVKSFIREDNNPSLSIFRRIGHKDLFFHDFATGEKGNIIRLLQNYWALSYPKTLLRIWKDMPKIPHIISIYNGNTKTIGNKSNIHRSNKIFCKVRNWKKHDLEYWNSYGISLEFLKFCDVYPISTIIVHKENKSYDFPADKYAYVYVERKDNEVTLKIYQPYNKEHKWFNSNDASVWNLWTKIPKTGDNLIITSSRKDSMCLWENTGIPSISMQGEGYMPKKKIIEELKNRYKNIYVLYDNDFKSKVNHGRIFGEKICSMFNLKQIEIPEYYQSKDPSDLYKNYGKNSFINIINKLMYIKN